MPYRAFFGFSDYPFALTPNPKLYYPSEETRALLAGLDFSLMRGDGLLKVVGEVGTGKTLIARLLLERLTDRPVATAYFNTPPVHAEPLPVLVAREFGVKVTREKTAMGLLRDFLISAHAEGKRSVLIVDEAQALGARGLEEVRLLSNLETNTQKLLQIVLFGQNELDVLLRENALRQIAQRIQFSFITKPMKPDVVADYVRFRLEHCLAKEASRAVFSPSALAELAKRSRGLPRIVNILADKALLAAYAAGKHPVEKEHVIKAYNETPDCHAPSLWQQLKKRLRK